MTAISDMRIEIGRRVHDFRVMNHYTQAQFAELIDISVNFLSEIENGKKGMSQDTIYRLCSYFHISADYLLFGEEAKRGAAAGLAETAASLEAEELDILIEYLEALKRVKELDTHGKEKAEAQRKA